MAKNRVSKAWMSKSTEEKARKICSFPHPVSSSDIVDLWGGISRLSDQMHVLAERGLLPDWKIRKLGKNIFFPFVGEHVSQVKGRKVVSYGVGSYGYDIRLSSKEFRLIKAPAAEPTLVLDPKRPDRRFYHLLKLQTDKKTLEQYFILPPRSTGLGFSVERFNMPPDIDGEALGKSTYARVAITPYVTPVEAGWRGHLTLEIQNNSDCYTRIYANEGIVKIRLSENAPCEKPYGKRNHAPERYQNQGQRVVFARV